MRANELQLLRHCVRDRYNNMQHRYMINLPLFFSDNSGSSSSSRVIGITWELKSKEFLLKAMSTFLFRRV